MGRAMSSLERELGRGTWGVHRRGPFVLLASLPSPLVPTVRQGKDVLDGTGKRDRHRSDGIVDSHPVTIPTVAKGGMEELVDGKSTERMHGCIHPRDGRMEETVDGSIVSNTKTKECHPNGRRTAADA